MSSIRNSGRPTAWARRAGRLASAIGVAAVLTLGLASCTTDSPTAPTSASPPSASLLGKGGLLDKLTSRGLSTTANVVSTVANTAGSATGQLVRGLRWTSPVQKASASSVIGSAGGTFAIPGGIRVIVPPGAVSANVTFTVTRLPGKLVAYDFQPHGTNFAVPVQIEQPAVGTSLLGLLNLLPVTNVRGAYFADESMLDQSTGTATVTEFRSATISADGQWIRFSVDHFSGYMVSMD